MCYTPNSALGGALLPKTVHMTDQLNGAVFDNDTNLIGVNTGFPVQLLLNVVLQVCVVPHGWISSVDPRADRAHSRECIKQGRRSMRRLRFGTLPCAWRITKVVMAQN